MTTFVYALGLLLCGIAGFIDRNPSVWRYISVISLFSLGILLLVISPKL